MWQPRVSVRLVARADIDEAHPARKQAGGRHIRQQVSGARRYAAGAREGKQKK